MSDLRKLFYLSLSDQKPLENFTTAALAIAIAQDPKPMTQALRTIDCSCQGPNVHPALAALKSASLEETTIEADTQTPLYARDGLRLGFLDLVLRVKTRPSQEFVIWVEVKVDAWESGDQLQVYRSHAERDPSGPAIITLGRTNVTPHNPFLTWSDIVGAIDPASGPDPHYTWSSLREFLLEEGIVQPRVSLSPPDVGACADVIVAVNERVRELWPQAGLVWAGGSLRKAMYRAHEDKEELIAHAGPVRYGLMLSEGVMRWTLVVTVGKNDQHVRLYANRVLSDAEAGGLPIDWQRHPSRPQVLQRTLAPTETSHDLIVKWFDEGLRQLHDAGVLKSYLSGYEAKQAVRPAGRAENVGADGGER